MLKAAYFKELEVYSRSTIIARLDIPDDISEKFFETLLKRGILKIKSSLSPSQSKKERILHSMRFMENTKANWDNESLFFDYVGIIQFNISGVDFVLKCYPKFFAHEPGIRAMRTILSALRKYNADNYPIDITVDSDTWFVYNPLSIILFLLQDYYDHGIYSNQRTITSRNGQGEIDWNLTINDNFPFLYDEKPFYVDLYTNELEIDDCDYISRLHRCILTECSNRLRMAELDSLFDIVPLELYDGSMNDFGDKSYIKQRIIKELNVQFITQKQNLLRFLYAFVNNDVFASEESGLCLFGTNTFNLVWEKACADVFNNLFEKSLTHIPIKLNEIWKDRSHQSLGDIIQKPIWTLYKTNTSFTTETLRPDIVCIAEQDGNQFFIILDAKYYNAFEDKGQLKNIPGIGDIDKQQLYELAFSDFTHSHHLKTINAFLFPSEECGVSLVGKVEMPVLSQIGLGAIQIVFLNAINIFRSYVKNERLNPIELFGFRFDRIIHSTSLTDAT